MNRNRRCDDGAPATLGNILQLPHDLGTFTSFGQSNDCRELRLKERCLFVPLYVQEHWEMDR
jgi:hypothetical protein